MGRNSAVFSLDANLYHTSSFTSHLQCYFIAQGTETKRCRDELQKSEFLE